jgi:hypothetical protein
MMNGFTECPLPKSINRRMDVVSGGMNSLSWVGMSVGCVDLSCDGSAEIGLSIDAKFVLVEFENTYSSN